MGVRVLHSWDENCSSYCTGSSTPSTPSTTTTPSQTLYDPEPPTYFKSPLKDIVGNCKEYRIERNEKDLRIIGNGNRVYIGDNTGNLQIIGNSTKVKIIQNSGQIKYTGNDGRIYLGKKSYQQTVDYIGCNGILKVVKSMDLSSKNKDETYSTANTEKNSKNNASKSDCATGGIHKTFSSNLKFKSASFDGGAKRKPTFNHAKQQHFQCKANNTSLPNLNANLELRTELTIVNNFNGNIVIRNALNVNL